MGITVLIACIATIAVVIFQVVFTLFEANPYKKVYYKFLLELSKAPKDAELKKRAIEAGNDYYSRIKSYGMGSFRGAVTSARMKTLIGPVDEKMLFEDMTRIVKIEPPK
ncbi:MULTISPECIES: hypothetical protein [unclassified Clostridium]|uniref:hypothetical protein n=1 Tax=unclassified Clostridium TaxID=2614128 RepID=UPI0002986186|nr:MULTISPECIES: hypothetical protein [unclassified Clostridium]EKQ50953.1 MAG: hypothetical protein A370_05235 [Clostridium sp. Maddingley MBC34-26]